MSSESPSARIHDPTPRRRRMSAVARAAVVGAGYLAAGAVAWIAVALRVAYVVAWWLSAG